MTTHMTAEIQKHQEDEILLVRQAISDADAFTELYQRNVTRVYRYHMAHTGNVKDAEDLTSQTFLAALESIRSFRGSGSFGAWILGIAARKRLMFFRKHRSGTMQEVPLDAVLQHPSPGLHTEKAATQRLQLESVSRALKQILPDRAEAIILSYFGGLSNLEASQAMNKSEGALKMLISRGLQDLRERTALVLEVEL